MSPRMLVPLALIVMSGAALAAAPAKKPAQHAAAAPKAQTLPPAAVRDWRQVDANHDNSVSPEEMEKYLAANPGPLKKS